MEFNFSTFQLFNSKPMSFSTKILLALFVVLLLPALLINLGLMSFIDDEGIRSLVALEMRLSGNYMAPTMNGEWYYNKPPLFNWILLGYYQVFGVWEEWVPRLATVVSLLGYAGTIYYFFRKHGSVRMALVNAMAFITCGRVLLWDSQLGLIDITFSWVTFLSFMALYHAFEKKRWWTLFLLTYLLTAVGFMMKGLPSVVFQGLTLSAWFAYKRAWRPFFSLAHVAGGLLAMALIGLYYWQYSHYHRLDEILLTLFSESSKRTVAEYGWWKTILHLFTFPFEMVYHFLPWSLGILLVFHRKVWAWLREDPFVFFLFLVFAVNIVLYWTSVGVYPRYLLMHAPLLFGVFFYLLEKHSAEKSLHARTLEAIWGGLLVLFFAASLLPLFWDRLQLTEGYWWKGGLLAAMMGALVAAYWRWREDRIFVLLLALLVFRLGFNWFVLPDRHREDWGTVCKEKAVDLATLLKAEPRLFIYKDTGMTISSSFYFTAVRQRILERKYSGFEEGDLIIIDPIGYPDVDWEPVGELPIRFEKKVLQVGRFRERVERGEIPTLSKHTF